MSAEGLKAELNQNVSEYAFQKWWDENVRPNEIHSFVYRIAFGAWMKAVELSSAPTPDAALRKAAEEVEEWLLDVPINFPFPVEGRKAAALLRAALSAHPRSQEGSKPESPYPGPLCDDDKFP